MANLLSDLNRQELERRRDRRLDRSDSYERDVDVDMQDTDAQRGSEAEEESSDHDSTTVSYSLEDESLREEEVEEEVLHEPSSRPETDILDFPPPPQHEVPPPSYDDVVREGEELPPPLTPQAEDERQTTPTPEEDRARDVAHSIEFPVTHFYELEARVHTDQWSIPYKREESLGVCMLATIRILRESPGLAEADEHCRKFLDRTMPDSFTKVCSMEPLSPSLCPFLPPLPPPLFRLSLSSSISLSLL